MAIVHDWLPNHGGGQRVAAVLAGMFPQADVFAVVAQKGAAPRLAGHRLSTSFLQRIPGSVRYHRHFLPLYPLAVEQFDLRGYDLVISSDCGPAKGVLTSTDSCHIAYCHSPMRYLWDFYHDYVTGEDVRGISRLAFRAAAHYLRMWDLAASLRVDHFVANSCNAAARIRRQYRRHAAVIYPPVDTRAAYIADRVEDYYLVVGRLAHDKRCDLAIEACRRLGRKLRVVGEGPQYGRLRKLAGRRVEFVGELSDEELREQYAHCRALIFPGEAEFAMVPVEAQSFGRPVIAYGRGGALESVVGTLAGDRLDLAPGAPTGVFFEEPSVESLSRALMAFESAEGKFLPAAIARNAARFSMANFEKAMREFVERKLRSSGLVNRKVAARAVIFPLESGSAAS